MMICIRVPDEGDCANYVKHVASQIENGMTSGHVDAETHWSIEDDA